MSKGIPRNDHRRNLDKTGREREQLAHFDMGDRVRLRKDLVYGDKMRLVAGHFGTVVVPPDVAPIPGCVRVVFDGTSAPVRLVPAGALDYLGPSSPQAAAPRAPAASGGDGRRTLRTPKR